ncbi:MAG: AMP-binding enzyme [Thiobacillaceae bacterium]
MIDCDGEHWVLGRADDVINVAAHRISTVELESVVSQTPGVAEAAVIAIDDAIKGTVPIAFISLCAGADADTVRRDAAQSVEKAIGGIARLERVVVTSALPKSRAGKILRRLLRELAETGTVKGDVSGLEDMATVDAVRAALSVQ